MRCPKCDSENVTCISSNYPRMYECKNCGHTFVKSPQALVDENL